MILVLLALACQPDTGSDLPSPGSGGGGGGTTNPCPTGMTYVPNARTDLGEWDVERLEQYLGNVIADEPFDTDPYCIDTYPAPNRLGSAWPTDGLSMSQLEPLEALLDAHARRLCTVPELMLAAAGPDNWRHPYDAEDRVEGMCEPDDMNPQTLGFYPNCESPMGVHDFEVRSAWAVVDEITRDQLVDFWGENLPGDGVYAAWGGTSRPETYYAPTNFGIHLHGEDDDPYTDDGLRVCADPGIPTDEQDTAWAQEMTALADAGSFAAWLGSR